MSRLKRVKINHVLWLNTDQNDEMISFFKYYFYLF